jgi:hypothetical protein
VPDNDLIEAEERPYLGFSFSQPAGAADIYFIGSQLATTPNSTNSPPIQRWVKRMTRFCVTTSVEKTVKKLTIVLDDLGYQWKIQAKPAISVILLLPTSFSPSDSDAKRRTYLQLFESHSL